MVGLCGEGCVLVLLDDVGIVQYDVVVLVEIQVLQYVGCVFLCIDRCQKGGVVWLSGLWLVYCLVVDLVCRCVQLCCIQQCCWIKWCEMWIGNCGVIQKGLFYCFDQMVMKGVVIGGYLVYLKVLQDVYDL